MSTASLSIQPVLQQYAQDAARANVQRVADFIAPTVEVGAQHGRFWIYDKETPFRIPKTLRAIGGRATQVVFGEGKGTYDCSPHALDTPLDELEIMEANQDAYTNIVQERADVVAWMGGLAHENRVIATARAAVGEGTEAAWGPNADPISDLNDVIFDLIKNIQGGSTMGIRLLLGADVWKTLHTHPELIKRLPNGATTGRAQGVKTLSLEDLGKMLAVQTETAVSMAVYDKAAEGQAQDLDWSFSDGVLAFVASASPNRMDPSWMKTFRLRNYWMKVGQYQRDDGRADVVKFDWSCDVKQVNSGAAKLLIPTWA